MKRIVAILGVVLLLASCVPNRKVVFLQKDDVKKMDLPIDTALRSYPLGNYDYKIQSQDILLVRFETLTDKEFDFLNRGNNMNAIANPAAAALSGELVDANGEITFPVIGRIKVAGLNIFEIQDRLQTVAADFLASPKVSVRLLNFRATVLGEVVREGQVVLMNNRVSMLEVVGLSGGFGELSDKSRVKLLRQEGGQVNVIYLNLLDENFITSPYYYVHQNDVLIVPPLNQRPFRRYFGPNLAIVVSTLSLMLLTLNLIKN